MRSKISFEADYSMSHVDFLDTEVKLNAHALATELGLYCKPSASFQYLHRTSSHNPHTFRSILKSQLDAYALTSTIIGTTLNNSSHSLNHVALMIQS